MGAKEEIDSRQQQIIRERMLKYVMDITPNHHEHYSWLNASKAIKKITDYDYPYDSLRQNIHSQNITRGLPPREIQDPARWNVLKDFLIEVGFMIDEGELPMSSLRSSPYSLYQFLIHGEGEFNSSFFKNFDGVFEGYFENKIASENITIDIEHSSDNEIVRVSSAIEIFGGIESSESEIKYSGWAIAIDNFCIFILRGNTNNNLKCLLLLQSSPTTIPIEEGDNDDEVGHIALISYFGALPNHLKTTFNNLSNDEIERSAEAYQFLSYSLNPPNYVPIIYLTRRSLFLMKSEGEDMASKKGRHFFPPIETGENEKETEMVQGNEIDIDYTFIMLVRGRKYDEAIELMPKVKNINVQSKNSGATALHLAVARNIRTFIDCLEEREDLNYCVKTFEGLFPSDMAAIEKNWQLADEFRNKESDHAREHGIEMFPPLPKWHYDL